MPQTKKQKAVVRRWVKNLESGLYKQGQNYLVMPGKKVDRFCCLGVLCHMAVREGVIAPPKIITATSYFDGQRNKVYKYSRKSTSLPPSVRKWAGLENNSGNYDDGNLAEMNDDGSSFKKIAKIIRSNPKGLFV